MKVFFVDGYKFDAQNRRAIRMIARESGPAFLEHLGAEPFIEVIHAMTQDEIDGDSLGDGGAGYMELRGNRIKIAINPNLTPRRTAEVWIEEQVHAIAPELSENIVRNHYVPVIFRETMRRLKS